VRQRQILRQDIDCQAGSLFPSDRARPRRITMPAFLKGFILTGIHCGIKKNPQVRMLLSFCPLPRGLLQLLLVSPATFSRLHQCWSHSRSWTRTAAVVVNSGCANAVIGKQGLADAWAIVRETDALFPPASASSSKKTLVMSTGVISQLLPISNIISGIKSQSPKNTHATTLGSGFDAWNRAARAFMPTDTFPKLRSRTLP
jgi:glutamate N-acetyltransferase/amino-acid N-acetyltransferase